MKYFNLISFLFASLVINSQNYIVDGYTDKQSYRAGENVTFFTKSFSNNPILPSVPLLKRGSNTAVGAISGFSPNIQPTQNFLTGYIDGFNYQTTNTWAVPSLNTLPSFVYYLDLPNPIPIVIKGDTNNLDVVVVFATNTENAYDSLGFKSTYPFNSSNSQPSPTVSFNRPLGINANGGYNKFDLGFFEWIEESDRFGGKKIGFICDKDLEDYREIHNAKLLIIIGHSEYWSRKMRENFDKFIDSGKNALILSGNTMWWQVRLQNDPNNPNNPQIVCNKYTGVAPFAIPDGNCDPRLITNNWNDQNLKYSTISSIGSDWGIGGFAGPSGTNTPLGFGKQKVILQNSPVLNGVNLQTDLILGDIVDPYSTNGAEIDGVLVKKNNNGIAILDNNGNPILDKEAIGFYKAELITYDIVNYVIDPNNNPPLPRALPFPQPTFYTGIVAMQKTCASGKVINVNCNQWCRPDVLSLPDKRAITQNMIDLLLNNGNIFANALPPNQFKITSAINNVSYEACATGTIKITPCGVSISDGYKVDATSAPFHASVINCSTCNRGARPINNPGADTLSYNQQAFTGLNVQKTDSIVKSNLKNELKNTVTNSYNVFPNPGDGGLTIETDLLVAAELNINLESINGQILLNVNQTTAIGRQKIMLDATSLKNGIYILKIINSTNNLLLKANKIIISR